MKLTAAGVVSMVLLQTNAWMVPSSSRRRRQSCTMLVDKNGDEKRTKIIAPGEIQRLFGGGGNGGSSSAASVYDDDYNEDEYDYGDSDEEPATKDAAAAGGTSTVTATTTATTASTTVATTAAATAEAAVARTVAAVDAESETMRELVALEGLAFRPAADVNAAAAPIDVDPSLTAAQAAQAAAQAEAQAAADGEDEGMGYMNLGRRLDTATRRSVANTMSMRDADIADPMGGAGGAAPAVRVVKYDPTEMARGDPMKYGAYRRWKLAETEDGKPRLDSQGKPLPGQSGSKSGRPSNSRDGYRQGDYKIEGQNSPGGGSGGRGRMLGGGGSGLKKKGKKKGADSDDNPMSNFIRKFGSGAGNAGTTKDGGVGGTGFSEPPPDKKPIQPKKAPTKKNKKRVITPDDINSLFPDRAKAGSAEEEEEDDEEGDDEEDDDEGEDGNVSVVGGGAESGALAVVGFNPLMGADEETPQWLADGEKEVKMQKKMKGKKKKRLTDDWRFWAACIVTAGFASAFWNIYQQTGGLGSGPGFSGFGGLPERQELII